MKKEEQVSPGIVKAVACQARELPFNLELSRFNQKSILLQQP